MGLFHDIAAAGLTAGDLQSAIDAAGQFPIRVAGTLSSETDGRGGTVIADNPATHLVTDVRLGMVTDKGPNDEPDYGDSRYWIHSLAGTGNGGTDPIGFAQDGSLDDRIKTATHIFEQADDTHNLSSGDLVLLLHLAAAGSGRDLYVCLGLPKVDGPQKIKIVSKVSDAGAWYNVKLVGFPAPTADIDKTTDADASTLGFAGVDAVAVNLTEVGREQHSHLIADGTEWLARRIYANSDGTIIAEFNAGPAAGEVFAVDLTFNEGDDGTAPSTPATWAYDVKAKSNGEDIGTNLDVDRPRVLAGQTVKATEGYAYYTAGGLLILAEAWETFGEVQCPSSSSSSSSSSSMI